MAAVSVATLSPVLLALVRKESRASLEGLAFGLPALDALLPDHDLPRGVTELCSPHALGLAGYAVHLLHELHKRPKTMAAWIDPEASLFAPAFEERGVDLKRLLVVRPKRNQLERTALKLTRSGAFDLVIVDVHPAVDPMLAPVPLTADINDVFVRKLALTDTRVLLLSNSTRHRSLPLPVALRLEIGSGVLGGSDHDKRAQHEIHLRKDRFGRIGAPSISLALDSL